MITELRQNIRERIVSHPFTKYRPVILTWRVAKEMTTRDANHLAAGVAYYAIFGLLFVFSAAVSSSLQLLQERDLGLPGQKVFL